MEVHIEGEESNSSDQNEPSESNLINGFSSLNEKEGESVTVTSGDGGPKKYTEPFNSLPDIQDECPRPLYQESDAPSDIVEESSQRMPQTSPRANNPIEAISHAGLGDSDVVSLVDIEASLEHIQSNGSSSVIEMQAEPLQSSNDDMKVLQCTEQSEKSTVIGHEYSDTYSTTIQVEENRAVSLDDGNQMECDKSNPASDSLDLDEKNNGSGFSNYAIMPGELTNQLVEGPCITLPPSELQSQLMEGTNKSVQSETVPQSEIACSVQQSEDMAPPSSLIPSDAFPVQSSTADTAVSESRQENVIHQAVDKTSEMKSTVPENSSSSEAKSDTTPNTTSSVTNHAPVKQKVKKTPHDFIFGKVVGEGSYSTVHLAKEVSTQKEFAIKVCDKKHLIRERKTHFVMREKEVLMKLDHPFFIKLAYTFQDPERLYYVLTYARNGELLTYLHKLSVFDVPCTRFYSAEIVLALEYLQTLGIVHRDLKPENILFGDDMHIKITDFGTSKIMEADVKGTTKDTKRKNSFVGTAEYVSPEVLNNLPANYGSDIWALGCIIYQCLSSSPPFRCGNEYQTFQKIIKLDYEFPEGFNEDAKDLVQKLLVIEPDERLGMHQPEGMAELKRHHFFNGIDWANLPNKTPPKLLPYLPATGDNPEFWGGQELRTGFDDQRLAEIITGQQIDTSGSSEVEIVPVKDTNQMEDTERQEKMAKQKLENPFHPFVEDNLILRQGFVDKRKGLFARKRMLLLTEGPHLYYVDAHNKILKGEIPWSKDLRPEAKNFKIFFVHTPNRTYYLESRNPDAHLWVKQIQDVWKRYYAQSNN